MFSSKRSSVLLLVALLITLLSLPAQAQDAPTIPAAACAEPGTLTVRVWDENWKTVIQSAVDAWTEKYCPGADVEVIQVPWGQYWDLLKTDAASGDLPDIFNMSQDQFYFYASNDALLNLTPYLDAAGIDSTVWGKGLVDPYRYGDNGDVYGAPLNWDTVALFYNKDLFDAAGLDYPTADWTWDEFATAAEKLTDPANGVWGASVYNDYQSGWANWVASTGVEPVATAGRGQCTFTEPGSVEALTFLKGLTDKGYMPTISQLGGTNADDGYNLFKSGKVAMFSNGEWQLPNFIKDVTDINWDIVQLPKNPTTGRSRAILHAVSYAASANTENPDLAANLIQYLASDEGEQFFADAGGVPPADPNPALQDAWINSFGDTGKNIQAFVDATADSQGVTTFGEAGQASTDLIVNIFDLGMSVEEATQKACDEITPFLNS